MKQHENDKLTPETEVSVNLDDFAEDTPPVKPEKPAKKKKGPNRKLRFGATATALTVIVIVGIVLLNVVVGILNDRYPLNLDLTADKEFTLSEESVKVAESIKEDVEVVVFRAESNYSAPNYGSDDIDGVVRQFYEAMKQYTARSGGHVKVQYFDATANPTRVAKYEEYEPDENTILFISGGRSAKLAMTDLFSYDEMAYMYYGQLMVTESKVEKALATSMLKVTGTLAPVILFTGHKESDSTLAAVESLLDLNGYTTVRHDITTAEEITTDATTAVLAAPGIDFGEEEILRLRDWLQNEGFYNRHLVVFAGAASKCPNLNEFLNEEYGIEIMDDTVIETDAGNYYNNNPNFTYGEIAESDYTKELAEQRVLSSGTRWLKLHKDNNPELSMYNVPLVTFGKSAKLWPLSSDSIEQAVNADSYPVVGAAYAHKIMNPSHADGTVDSYLAVFGSPEFVNQGVLKSVGNAKNGELFMSLFNGIAGSTERVSISARPVGQNNITLDSGTQTLVGIVIFTVALPLATLMIGLVVFLKRRHL